jgi:hypothetical protein
MASHKLMLELVAGKDITAWGRVKRNVISDAHPPRVPRKGRKVWTVAQIQGLLRRARSDRFFALWMLEATSGMRRPVPASPPTRRV